MRSILIGLAVLSIFLVQSHIAGQRTSRSGTQRRQVSTSADEPTAVRNQSGRAFTSEEKALLVEKFLANPRMAQRLRAQRSRVLSVALAPAGKDTSVRLVESRVAQVVLFSYTEGRATLFLVDSSNGEILSEEILRGRPQASVEEIQEAIRIIRQDREVGRVLQEKAVIEGGFVVDGPPGSKPNHRFLQLQVLSPDRLRLQRVVVVDLTEGVIALSRATMSPY